MTDFTQLSDKELSEAIDFHRRQRNMSRGVNESMHMRQVQTVRLLEAEEARRLDEAQVKKPTKSERSIALPDGEPDRSADMKVNKVAYALDKEPKKKVSLPKAPWNEEAELDESPNTNWEDGAIAHSKKQERVAKQQKKTMQAKNAASKEFQKSAEIHAKTAKADHDTIRARTGQYEAFDDESKAHDRHYEKQTPAVQNALDKYTRQGMSYKQAHAKISNPLTGHRLRKEITPLHEEQIDELKKSTLASYVKKASTDQYLKGQAVQYHTNKAQTADGVFAKQSKEKHYDAADKALKKASNRDTGIGRAVDRLAKEEVELDEAPLLGPKGEIHRAASMDQSDREYLHQRMFKDTWKSKNPGKQWPGYEKAGYKHPSYRNEEVELTEAETNYVIKHKKTKQVLNTHSDYNTAKDEHEGLGDEKSEYGIYKQTKKDAALRNRNTYREEVEQIDEISASTLQSYVGKARDSKKAEMKNRTAAKNDMKKYGNMAMDKKAHDDAARKVVNRGTGISVANRKLGTYPTDKAKAKVMAREEVEQIDEISDDLKARYLDKAVQQRYDRFVTPRNTSVPKLKGKAKKDADAAREKANTKDSRRADIIDKTAEKLTGKPHYNKMSTTTTPAVHGNTNDWWKGKKYSKEEVELDEASYRDSGYANMLKASRKADKEADKMRAKHEKEAKKAGEPKAEFKEEADLRITKVYNKWPKKATYAVHTPDRKYFKEFDSMEAAKAHHAEKSGK